MTNEKLKSFIAEITFIYISYRNGTCGVHGLYMWHVQLVHGACTTFIYTQKTPRITQTASYLWYPWNLFVILNPWLNYSAIQIDTRFRSFSANGWTRAPFESEVIRSAGMLYCSMRVFTTFSARCLAMRSLMMSLPVPASA